MPDDYKEPSITSAAVDHAALLDNAYALARSPEVRRLLPSMEEGGRFQFEEAERALDRMRLFDPVPEDHEEFVRIASFLESLATAEVPPATDPRGGGWPELQDLPSARPQAPTMTPEMIPAPLRPWITDACERTNVLPEMVAVPAIISAGATIGRRIGIHPKQQDSWLEVPNLWGAVVAPPSSRKSFAIAEGTGPLKRLAEQARKEHEAAQVGRAAEAEITKLQIEGLKKQARVRHGTHVPQFALSI